MPAKAAKQGGDHLKGLFELFSNKPKLLILVHPDPDSIASALALRRIVLRKCSKVAIAYDEEVKRLQNRAMIHLLKVHMVNVKEVKFIDFDLVAVVDGQRDHFPLLANKRVDLCIDHHSVSTGYAYRFADIRPEFGATSSIMSEYLEAARVKVSRSLATALCYGIKTDTDNFTRNVQKPDAVAFSRLFPRADYYLLRSIDLVEISIHDLGMFRAALERLRVKRKRAVIHLGQVTSADLLVIIADFLIRVFEVQDVMVSGFAEGRLTIIFRNRNLRRNIGALAKKAFESLGSAGGHRYAARAEISLQCLPRPCRRMEADGEVLKWIQTRLSHAKAKSLRPGGKAAGLCRL